jgi:hypothetical protein
MTVTLAALNQTVLDSCDSTTDNDAAGTDTVDYKEGSASCYWTKRSSGNNDCTFTKASGTWDLSGTTHVRFWGLFVQGSLINVEASGGLQFWATDGSNTGYWYIAGRDTYPGGWYNFVINVAENVDTGTKPTMTAITQVGVRINLTGAGKNFANTWIDNFQTLDGVYASGDSGTGNQPFDMADVQVIEESPTTGGYGITRRLGGVSFVCGAVYIGDDTTSAADAYFESQNEVVIFEDRRVSATLYELKPLGSVDTGQVIEFALGIKSGTAGISGTFVGTEDSAQTGKWSIDGTDTYVDEFFLMGSTFVDGTVTLPNNSTAAEAEVLNCAFILCGPTDVNICNIKNCNFISADDVGALVQSTSHNMTYCNFIDCDHGVDFDTAGTYSLIECYFTNATGQYDIEFSDPTTGSDLIINATKGDPSTYEITGNGDTVTINNTVVLTIAVVDNAASPIQGARVYLYTDDTAQTVIFNELTDTAGEVTDTGYNYTGEEAVTGWVRKATSAPYYETANMSGTITANGLDLTVQLNDDQ